MRKLLFAATFAADSGAWLWDMTTMVFGSIIDFLNALLG